MEENNMNEVMNNDVEVLDENTDLEEISSGNPINMGVAVAGAAVIGGLIAGGIAIAKKIKAKKAAKEDDPAETDKPNEKSKGWKLGKHKRIVVIDERSATPATEEDPDEEE